MTVGDGAVGEEGGEDQMHLLFHVLKVSHVCYAKKWLLSMLESKPRSFLLFILLLFFQNAKQTRSTAPLDSASDGNAKPESTII